MTTRPDVLDMIDQLCATHTQRQRYQITHLKGRPPTFHHHTTRAPALVDQLAGNVAKSTADQGGGFSAKSKPAANIEALDAYLGIDRDAAKWVRKLGEDDPGETKACIRKLAGLRASVDERTRHTIDRDIARWWTRARILTGWDIAPWKPRNTCPACAESGTLRIHLSDEIAACTECPATWEPTTIGVLADHIRAENGDPDRHTKEPVE